jgi:hypothetical protein
MVSTVRHDVAWGDGTVHTLVNHNKLLDRYPGTIGVKTGYTAGAGPSLISAVRRGDNTLIAVVLGAPGQTHYSESTALYDWAFSNLPALLAHPESELPQPTGPAGSAKRGGGGDRAVRVGGLDVVQLRAPQPTGPHRYPVTTAIGLCAVAIAGVALIRRRPRATLRTVGPEGPVDRTPLTLGADLRRFPPF